MSRIRLLLMAGLLALVPIVSASAATPPEPAVTPTVSVSLIPSGCSFTATYTWSGFPTGRHTASVVVIQNHSFSVGVFTRLVSGTSGTLTQTFGPLASAPDGVRNRFVAYGQLSDERSGNSVDESTDFSGEAAVNCALVL